MAAATRSRLQTTMDQASGAWVAAARAPGRRVACMAAHSCAPRAPTPVRLVLAAPFVLNADGWTRLPGWLRRWVLGGSGCVLQA